MSYKNEYCMHRNLERACVWCDLRSAEESLAKAEAEIKRLNALPEITRQEDLQLLPETPDNYELATSRKRRDGGS